MKTHIELNFEERECLRYLALATNCFMGLGNKHPNDNHEFCQAIHDAQKLVAIRVARRVDPGIWHEPE